MKYTLVGILLLMVTLLIADYEILESTAERYLIKITNEDYKIVDDNGFTHIHQDWTRPDTSGSPDLPFKIFHFSVPPGGFLDIRLVSSEIETINLSKPVAPVPEIIKIGKTHDFIYNIKPELYDNLASESLQMDKITRFRFYEIVPVIFSPFLYDHDTWDLTIYRNAVVEINIRGNTDFRNNIPDNFTDSYAGFILNYDQAKSWVTVPEISQVIIPFDLSEFWYKIVIKDVGSYLLTGSDLQELPDYCDPGSIRILQLIIDKSNESKYLKELPLWVNDDDGLIDDNDRIYFDVEKTGPVDPTTGFAYLWLTFGGRFTDQPLRTQDLQEKAERKTIIDLFPVSNELITSREVINSILIYPEEFFSQTQNLTELHLTHYDLESELADQQDIFDMYSGGIPDPEAIKDFLESRFIEHPELEYVILMGSGTEDWSHPTEKNRIITYNGKDDLFVTFNNSYPELKIARLPAQNSTDLTFLVDRITQYIENPVPGWWRNIVLLQPDDENKSGGFEGTSDIAGMNHTMRAEMTANLINNSVFIDKLYAIEYDLDPYQNKPDVRNEIIERINEGRLIWYFIGHGDHDVLGDEEYFRSSLHLRLLENNEKLPLFLAASCSVGEFDKVEYDCTAEKLLFHRDGGSIVSIAASRACGPINNTKLMFAVIDECINERHNIGTSLFNAKLLTTGSIGTSNLYNLLGDPLLPIYPPERFLITTDPPDSLKARQTGSVTGNFGNIQINSTTANLKVYDSDYFTYYRNELNESLYHIGYRKYGNTYFSGLIEVTEGSYNADFIVPDDIRGYKEISNLVDFYINVDDEFYGFIAEGDKTSEINKNFHVIVTSPLGDQYLEVDTVRVINNQTEIIFKDILEGSEFSVDNFGLFLNTGGRVITYVIDDNTQQEYLSYFYPIIMDKIPLNIENSGPPQVQLMLDSHKFQDGDYVSTSPLLIADIEDENGINILGSSGHKILALIDDGFEPIDVSTGFVYELNSHTKGVLTWQLPVLDEGHHTIQLIVFDNFNLPTVISVDFITRKSSKVAIEQMLPYPNPMKDDGYFTFVVTEDSEISIIIYTITGKKIRTLNKIHCDAGYNQIYWNGKDEEGDKPANNTYFYKIKARQSESSKTTEKIGKFIILK